MSSPVQRAKKEEDLSQRRKGKKKEIDTNLVTFLPQMLVL
jgi:hypothetical protein